MVAGYQIGREKSVAFVYTGNVQSENEQYIFYNGIKKNTVRFNDIIQK